MADSKKRNAEAAFTEHEPSTHKSRKRRKRTSHRKTLMKDMSMIDVPSEAPSERPIIQKKPAAAEKDPIAKIPTGIEAAKDPTPEELADLAARRKKNKKGNKEKKLEKSAVDHIGSHAVVKANAKPPKKDRTPRWKLSKCVGGVFIDQDPLLMDHDQYLIIPTESNVQIYSTKTSLLMRTLHVGEAMADLVTSCVSDPSNSSNIFVSKQGGTVQKWEWTTGKKLKSWTCQIDLLRIVAVMPVAGSPQLCTVLTAHGGRVEKSRLLRSDLATSSTKPTQEVLLLGEIRRWSTCRSFDGGNVLILWSGKQLTIGQLLAKPKDSSVKEYIWREVTVPQPIISLDVRLRDRPKTVGGSPVKMMNVVIGCLDGVIFMYEDLLYRLIGKEKGIKDIDILSRRLHWHRQAVNTLKWSHDGNYLVSGGNETVLVIWQLDTNQQQFLPHLSTPILNLTISAAGSSYALRLADNSIMVLSTADLLPSANISGLALTEKVNRSAAALNSRASDQLLVAVHADPLSQIKSSATLLQTFDVRSSRQVDRQALTRNMTTALRAGPDGGKVIEPTVTHLKASHDGEWLVTVDKWHPKPRDLDALHTAKSDRIHRNETCLRFWKWQEDGATWELVTRVDEPHSTVSNSVLDLVMHPSKLEATTIGQDGMLRIWVPMARHRDGVPIKGTAGQPLYTWMCSRSSKLEPEPPTKNIPTETSGALAYSEDGSVLAASWSWAHVPKQVVHLVNAQTGELSLTQANIVSHGPAQLAFSGRSLIALSRKLCIWDAVALRKTYSLTLQHAAREGKILAVNTHDNTFAMAFDSRKPGTPSSIAVFDVRDPHNGPLHQGKIHGHVRILLPHVRSPGFLIVDAEARIRHLEPPGVVRVSAPIAVKGPEDATRGLKDIFGARMAIQADSEAQRVSNMLVITDENAEQKSLDGVLSSFASVKLPSVRQMFEQVASLFARKPAEEAEL